MTIKQVTIKAKEILHSESKRFDFGYYYINRLFDNLSKNLKIRSIDELKEYIISGSYIDTYLPKSVNTIPYIRVATIKQFFLNENDFDFVFVSKNVPKKIKAKTNDIVIGRTAVLGFASIIDTDREFAISQHVTRLRLNDKYLSPEYTLAYLNSNLFKKQMIIASSGTSRLELTHSQLKK